jgi:hypothetical protein
MMSLPRKEKYNKVKGEGQTKHANKISRIVS